MSEPYLGEIRMFAGNFAPQGWAICDGSLLAIQQYTALFNLVGTTYGGNGTTTFGLPDLRGRVPIHQGTTPLNAVYPLGQAGGSDSVTLTLAQLPAHTHAASGNPAAASSDSPLGAVWAASAEVRQFAAGSGTLGAMDAGAVGSAGGAQAHTNLAPSIAINFIIALSGVYPSQS